MAKMTDQQIWETEFFQKHIQVALDHYVEDARASMLSLIQCNLRLCESPLEAAFMAQWIALTSERHNFDLDFQAQRKVTANGHHYRLDFVFAPSKFGWFAPLIGHPHEPKVAVEMDGHEFHERTADQVTERNRRDRDLQSAGWTVLHLSGSEFNRDGYAATDIIRDLVSEPFYRAMHAHVIQQTA